MEVNPTERDAAAGDPGRKDDSAIYLLGRFPIGCGGGVKHLEDHLDTHLAVSVGPPGIEGHELGIGARELKTAHGGGTVSD